MGDIKEDLLDTAAIFKEKFKDLGFRGILLILLTFCLWPLFYFLLAFSFLKFTISGIATLYLSVLSYKSNSKFKRKEI